jgi:hypothetical protein
MPAGAFPSNFNRTFVAIGVQTSMLSHWEGAEGNRIGGFRKYVTER